MLLTPFSAQDTCTARNDQPGRTPAQPGMTSQDGSSAEAENPTLSLSWWQGGRQVKRVKEPWQCYLPPKERKRTVVRSQGSPLEVSTLNGWHLHW